MKSYIVVSKHEMSIVTSLFIESCHTSSYGGFNNQLIISKLIILFDRFSNYFRFP